MIQKNEKNEMLIKKSLKMKYLIKNFVFWLFWTLFSHQIWEESLYSPPYFNIRVMGIRKLAIVFNDF